MLIVCEGEVTEAEYFDEFRRELRASVELIIDDTGGSPKQLVERATIKKREAERLAKRTGDAGAKFSAVWCVFDVDKHARIPEARQQARDNDVSLAISNPCFELWILLHFRDQTAYIDGGGAASACRTFCPDYRKHPPIRDLRTRYADAVSRAVSLRRRNERDGEPNRNPSTNVDELTEALFAFASPVLKHISA